jgi:hypothetical protein
VSGLVNDALAVLAAVSEADLDQEQAEAVALLALVAGQDVEPGERPGSWRIARKVAKDRVISTVDPQARHTRKTAVAKRDGSKGHIAAEPESGLVTECALTAANAPDGPTGVGLLAAEQPGLEVLADSAYGGGQSRAALRAAGHTQTIKPILAGGGPPGRWRPPVGQCRVGGEVVLGGKLPDVADLAEEPGGQHRPHPNNSSMVKRLAPTWQMLVGISELVSYGFYQFDLHLCEVIATGTPSGVALGLKSWLRPGDSVEAKIEGVGTLHKHGGRYALPGHTGRSVGLGCAAPIGRSARKGMRCRLPRRIRRRSTSWRGCLARGSASPSASGSTIAVTSRCWRRPFRTA